MTKNDLFYMAGFFDGEGYIGLGKRNRKHWNPEYSLRLSIGQNDGGVIDWVVERFGGFVHKVKRDGSYMWIVTNRNAHSVLKQIEPYLVYKKPQARLAMEFYDRGVRKTPIPKEELERREKILIELKAMKKVFSPCISAGSTTKRIDPKGM